MTDLDLENELKTFNLKFLSDKLRKFKPEIKGNFVDDKKYFSDLRGS